MKSFVMSFRSSRAKDQEARDKAVRKLEDLENKMLFGFSDEEHIESKYLNTFASCEELALDANGELSDLQGQKFFEPLSRAIYHDRRVNFDHGPTHDKDRSLRKIVLRPEELKFSLDFMDHAENLERFVIYNFTQYPRMATPGNARSLRALTRYIPRGYAIIAPDLKLEASRWNRPEWSYRSVWKTRGGGLFPHTMFTLVHGTEADNDHILRGELLLIVDVIRSRLKDPEIQSHKIIPTLLFSFMGNRRARIIQAHFDGSHLVIRKSRLYDFSTEAQLNASLSIFMRWMANEPVGDTMAS